MRRFEIKYYISKEKNIIIKNSEQGYIQVIFGKTILDEIKKNSKIYR